MNGSQLEYLFTSAWQSLSASTTGPYIHFIKRFICLQIAAHPNHCENIIPPSASARICLDFLLKVMCQVQLEEREQQEQADAQRCIYRLRHLNETGLPAKDRTLDWSRQRLPRVLADHLLRSGHTETASLLTKSSNLQVKVPFCQLIQ